MSWWDETTHYGAVQMERWIFQHQLQWHTNTNTVFRIHSLDSIKTKVQGGVTFQQPSNNSPRKYSEDTETYWGILHLQTHPVETGNVKTGSVTAAACI